MIFWPLKRHAEARSRHLAVAGLVAALSLSTTALNALPASAAAVEKPHIVVELVSETETLQPGQDLSVALRLTPEPGWHVYWRNPGETGLPPKLNWDLPNGFAASELQWPRPERIDTPPYAAFGYEGAVFLPASISTPTNLSAGDTVALNAKASWLVCQTESCVPGNADLELTMSVEPGAPLADARWVEEFVEARQQLPKPLQGWKIQAWNEQVDGDPRVMLELLAPDGFDPQLRQVAIYSTVQRALDSTGPHTLWAVTGGLRIEAKPFADLESPLEYLDAVLVADGAWDFEESIQAAAISVPVAATRPAKIAALTQPSTSDSAVVKTSAAPIAEPAPTGLALALFLAFVGGLILNLMPCVFPVLSLKILGFVQIAHNDAAEIRRHGAIFGLGVLVSFWILAALLLLLRAAGHELGWGFQLQSPLFVAAMIFILFSMALNLLGVFEVGTSLTGAVGRFENGSGYRSSFASGALATVLATPCTAPFMGTALGFALTQSAAASLGVFTALGCGMAAPYVLLSWFPKALRGLPRPGAWMETFKQVMAFPLLATSVWLLWVFGLQVGNDALVRLLAALVTIAFAAWMTGRRQSSIARGPRRNLAGGGTIALATAAALYLGISAASFPTSSACAADCDLSVLGERGPRSWIPYSEETLAALRSSGRPVFVDFTAAWCLSCKVNEQVTFSSDEVWQRIAELNMAMVKADWTNGSPEVTRALEGFGRQSVPLYVIYPSNADAAPIILPELINPSIVLTQLASLS